MLMFCSFISKRSDDINGIITEAQGRLSPRRAVAARPMGLFQPSRWKINYISGLKFILLLCTASFQIIKSP